MVAVSFLGGWNRNTWRKSPTCRKSLTNFITWCCIEYTSPWAGFELTTLVSQYHVPLVQRPNLLYRVQYLSIQLFCKLVIYHKYTGHMTLIIKLLFNQSCQLSKVFKLPVDNSHKDNNIMYITLAAVFFSDTLLDLIPVEQELLTLLEHLSSPPIFSRVRVTRSLVLYVCFVDRCLFSFGHCVVCSSLIYRF